MTSPLLYGYVLDGSGRGAPLGWDETQAWMPERGHLWLHVDRTRPEVRPWLESICKHESAVDALLAEETRPRAVDYGNGLLVNLRGVNLNEGADPEDMVVVRVWAEPARIVTLAKFRVRSVDAIGDALGRGAGPQTVGDVLEELAMGLTDRLAPVNEEIEESLDDCEDRLVDPDAPNPDRIELAILRRRVIGLRRFLGPQVSALTQLAEIDFAPFEEEHRSRMRELANRATRYVEDLDAARARSAVIQDEISNQLAENVNNRMYLISVIAGIFLPLTLISGLFGMNVGGMPLTGPWGFAIVTWGLVALGVVCFLLIRRRWL